MSKRNHTRQSKINHKGKFFDWTQPIGLGDLTGIIALILSVVALFVQQHYDSASIETALANPVVKSLSPFGLTYYDKNHNKREIFEYNRIEITNNGGRAVTLNGLTESPDWSMVYSRDFHDNLKPNDSIAQLSLMHLNMDDIKRDPSTLDQFTPIEMEQLSMLNYVINPGETRIINLGVMFDAYSGPILKYSGIAFMLDLNFSNGQDIPFKYFYEFSKR